MGFSGGGSNILKNHTHDSGILQDGGNLNMQGVTQGNMSTGSMPYSDGANLQELVKGVDGQTMQLSGGFPSWQTATVGANQALSNLSAVAVNATMNMNSNIVTNVGAGAGMAKMETIANYETTGTVASHTFTFSPVVDLDLYQFLYITVSGVSTQAADLEMEWNSLTTAYDYNYSEDDNGTWSFTEATGQSQQVLCDSGLLSGAKSLTAKIWLLPHESNTPTEVYRVIGDVNVEGEGRSLFFGLRAPSDINNLTSLTIGLSAGGFFSHGRFRISGCVC